MGNFIAAVLRFVAVPGANTFARLVESVGREHGVRFPMQGTIAASDGATLWTFRYSTQGRSRTLFHSVDIPTIRELYPDAERLSLFGDNAHVVVSEPLNDLPAVSNGTLLSTSEYESFLAE